MGKAKVKTVGISVIVPIYNVEAYLRECLDSLESQTFRDFEVIMVNDGSTDGSGAIACEYAKKNNNFILINQENGGLSSARNYGIKAANGRYIYFLDSDDFIVETALEVLYNMAETEELDLLLFSSYTFQDDYKELLWGHDGGYKYNGIYSEIYTGQELLHMLVNNNDSDIVSCCLIFTRMDIIREYSLSFLEGIIHEDNLFHLELVSISKKTAVLNKPLYCRRKRIGSITSIIDYKAKALAMYSSAKAADEFYEVHTDYHTAITDHFIEMFLCNLLNYWELMGKDLRKDSEITQVYANAKTLMKKNKFWHNRDMKIFAVNESMFLLFRSIVKKLSGYKE